MRKQFVKTTEFLLENDPKTVLFLGDIGVFGFRNAFKNYPERVYNLGILEQAMISLSAGLSKTGLKPIVHTIAPFLVERCLEQLKVDFGYQSLGASFISVGGSYDYASLGCTHHCPGDVQVLKSIPNMEIIVPGTALEFNKLFIETHSNCNPTYIRLSENKNSESYDVKFGKAKIIKKGKKATIVVVGTAFRYIYPVVKDLDVTILYYTTVIPFDNKTLNDNCSSGKVVLCEPFYEGTLTNNIYAALKQRYVYLECIGIPNRFIDKYGTTSEIDNYLGFEMKNIKKKVDAVINE